MTAQFVISIEVKLDTGQLSNESVAELHRSVGFLERELVDSANNQVRDFLGRNDIKLSQVRSEFSIEVDSEQ